ncbi:MAG TPA: hypothetical protein VF686_02890, partial [Brevundimonas sp.]
MRSDASGAKPKYGYIAITFSATARCGVCSQSSGEKVGTKANPAVAGFRKFGAPTVPNPAKLQSSSRAGS